MQLTSPSATLLQCNFVNSLTARPALPLNYLKLRCRRVKTTHTNTLSLWYHLDRNMK